MTTVLLLVSSGMILVLSVFLVGDTMSAKSGSWMISTRTNYLLFPACVALASLVARRLQAKSCAAHFSSAEVLWGVAATNHRLLFTGIPALILAEWIVSSAATAAVLDPFQLTTLGAALMLSVYRMQTGRDDW